MHAVLIYKKREESHPRGTIRFIEIHEGVSESEIFLALLLVTKKSGHNELEADLESQQVAGIA